MQLGDWTAETGGNTGSDFRIVRYNDSGGYLASTLIIDRASGDIIVEHDPTQALGVATKQYVDAVAFTNPPDDKYYARQGGVTPSWVPTVDEAPLDGGQYVRESGGWVARSLTPGAPVNSIQFNNAGMFGGDANLTWVPSGTNPTGLLYP
jgi:hypothetical protein